MRLALDELYQEVILDHNRKPRNCKVPEGTTHSSHGYNPLCGDDYHIYVVVDNEGKIQTAGFQGTGCAISKASASLLTLAVKGKTLDEVRRMKDTFVAMCTRDGLSEDVLSAVLGDLMIFEGVKKFPIRVKCATLIWHTLDQALKQEVVK